MSEQAGRPIPELIPVRMLNEFVYCPRLAYLEWADGEFLENVYTLEGSEGHRRVERAQSRPLPKAQKAEPLSTHSVLLSSAKLGLTARVELVETEGEWAVPVDYKRGKRPHVPTHAYLPERVQLCAQGLLLREAGYRCEEGILYFIASRERVRVDFAAGLVDETMRAIEGLRAAVSSDKPPPPLEDSPKCPGCSLLPICLPDEVGWLQGSGSPPRPLYARRETAWPLYVSAYGARVGKQQGRLRVEYRDGKTAQARLSEVSQLVLIGPVSLSTPALVELARRDIPVTYLSSGGWLQAHTIGTGHHNVSVRTAQYRHSFRPRTCLKIARRLVAAKVANSRTLLRRNGREVGEQLRALRRLRAKALKAASTDRLLGVEGAAAAHYFGAFPSMLRKGEALPDFQFERRNRRPPRDPVNCLLSFAYALLLRHWLVALSAVGLDPYRGFYHQPRFARPSLALDLMEPYRPLLADSAVITAINNGEVRVADFRTGATGCALEAEGRRRFIGTFERRLDQQFTHPVFGYRISYRRSLEVDARLFGRFLTGEFDRVPVWTTR